MRLGLGVIGWSSAEFWPATVRELYAAVAGYQEANGIETEPKHLTTDEMIDLMARFPDDGKPN